MTAHSMTFRLAGVSGLRRPCGMKGGACAAMALASAILLGGSVEVLAQTPDPAADHVYGGCVLSEAAIAALEIDASVEDTGGEEPEAVPARISFVVVYTLTEDPEDNDGQTLGAGSTGPVICINPVDVNITAFEADGETPLTEQSDIPTDTDPNFEDGNTVDVLETEEAFIIKYQHRFDEETLGDIEKRICHTVDENVDCFIISPLVID